MKITRHKDLLIVKPENDEERDIIDMAEPFLPLLMNKLSGLAGTALTIAEFALKNKPNLIKKLGTDIVELADKYEEERKQG